MTPDASSSMDVRRRPLLSIGMPIYNGARFVREAIESILAQDCDLELVISDNGSTDDTERICRDYAAGDSRISYHRYAENRGAAWNYNNCFKLARGTYFKWAAYDDRLAPDFCRRCLELLEEDPEVVLAYTQASIIDADGNFVRYDSDRMNLIDGNVCTRFRKFFAAYEGDNICNPVFGIFRAEVLRRTRLIGGFVTSDRILLGEVSLHGRIREIPEGLFHYRWHPQNSTYGYTPAERILWFDPLNKGKLCLLRWTWFWQWSDAIAKAPITALEKAHCKLTLLGWAMQNHHCLTKELIKGLLWPVLRRTPHYRGRDTGY